MRRNAALLACLALATPSCGAPQPARAPAAERWSSMSKDEKLAYMTDVVMPRMKDVFEAYDSHRFAKLGCVSCHGADGEKRGWAMPSTDLLLVPSPWNSAAAAPDAAPSEFDAFMAESVTPEMAKLLGRQTGAPTQGGFGCFGCHTPER